MATTELKPTKVAGPEIAPAAQRRYVNSWRQKIPLYERRYEMTSAQMLERVQSGQARETKEIREWLDAYSVLRELNQLPATTAITPPGYLFRRRKADQSNGDGAALELGGVRVRQGDGAKHARKLRRRIRVWEQRYEVSSTEMLQLLSCGREPDTVEALFWMGDYHELQLLEGAIPTAGTLSKITRLSTKNS